MKECVRYKYTLSLLFLLLSVPAMAHFVLPKPIPPNASTAFFYFKAGFKHVFTPNGYSHLLLLLSLYLTGDQPRHLIWQWLIFFAADLIALSFTVFNIGFFSIDIILSPVLAFVAAIMAVQNLESKKVLPARYPILIATALLHSLIFGNLIQQEELSWGQKTIDTFTLNAGVNTAQLLFFLLLHFTIGRYLSNKPYYRNKVVKPVSIGIIAASALLIYTNIYTR